MAAPLALPHFFDLKHPQTGKYLTLDYQNGKPYLSFTAGARSRLTTHEILNNVDEKNVFLIRAANGFFWRMADDDFILADKEGVPTPSLKECYFESVPGDEPSTISWRTLTRRFLNRNSPNEKLVNVYKAAGVSSKESKGSDYSRVVIGNASDTSLVFPKHIMFKGDNGQFMNLYWNEGADWLKFKNESDSLRSVFTTVPQADGSVLIQSIKSGRYWRRDTNWVKATVNDLETATKDINCHFEPVKLSSSMVAFKCLANNKYVKRLSDYWDDFLNAATDDLKDSTTHLIVSDASKRTSIFDVRYLLHLAQVNQVHNLVVGQGSMINYTGRKTDLNVTVSLKQSVTESRSWSNSSTFSVEKSITVKAGIPELVDIETSFKVGFSHTTETKYGKKTTNAITFQARYVVKDVPPGAEAIVIVHCNVAECTIPFTYKAQETRADGVDMPVEDHVDGIFECVTVFNAKGEIREKLPHSSQEIEKGSVPASVRKDGTDFPSTSIFERLEEGVETVVTGTGDAIEDVAVGVGGAVGGVGSALGGLLRR